MGEVDIVELVNIKKKNYTVVLGLAGTSIVGNTALMYIARMKRFKEVAHLRSKHIPPMMIIAEGEVFHPFRIYIDETNDVLLIVTESPLDSEGCYAVALALFNWLQDKGIKDMYCIDVLPVGNIAPNIKAIGYTNKIDLSKFGIPQAMEGAIAGVSACLMDECLMRDIAWATLFIPITRLVAMDYGATANAVDLMNQLFKFGVDSAPLKQSDENLKKALDQQQQKSGLGKVFNRR
jgi:uncharacterized protein